MGAYVALVEVQLHFGEVSDLKAKRKQLKSLTEQLRGRLRVSVAEVDHQDKWQRATVAVAAVAGSAGGARRIADDVGRFLDARVPDGVRFEVTVASFDDVSGLG